MPADPWAFGWTQLLTLIGFAITIGIAAGGFRTFKRWRREKIEERKLECAFDCLALAYESKYVFQNIRSPMSFGYEWADMPATPGETEAERSSRGSFYATLKRIENNRDFFERLYKQQPVSMSVLGTEVDEIFLLAHKARRTVEVAASQLRNRVGSEHRAHDQATIKLFEQLERDIWDTDGFEPEKDRVGKQLQSFRGGIEKICRPIVERH